MLPLRIKTNNVSKFPAIPHFMFHEALAVETLTKLVWTSMVTHSKFSHEAYSRAQGKCRFADNFKIISIMNGYIVRENNFCLPYQWGSTLKRTGHITFS